MHMLLCIYIYIYMNRDRHTYTYIHIYIYIRIYIYIYTRVALERGRSADVVSTPAAPSNQESYSYTVSFHNFKSQNFKLSVSNPKSKYVAYLSVLSQISSCQSLGRKNKKKHEILKTDRTDTFWNTTIANLVYTIIKKYNNVKYIHGMLLMLLLFEPR